MLGYLGFIALMQAASMILATPTNSYNDYEYDLELENPEFYEEFTSPPTPSMMITEQPKQVNTKTKSSILVKSL